MFCCCDFSVLSKSEAAADHDNNDDNINAFMQHFLCTSGLNHLECVVPPGYYAATSLYLSKSSPLMHPFVLGGGGCGDS